MMKIIIVDERDNVISYKERDKVKHEDIYRISCLWVTNSSGEILIARRAFTKLSGPGKWGPACAGTVEKGETYDSNILKEAKEELGLENIKFTKGPKERVSGKRHSYFAQWYLLKLDRDADKFRIQKEEVEEVKWISKDELLKRLETNPEEFVSSMKQWVFLPPLINFWDRKK